MDGKKKKPREISEVTLDEVSAGNIVGDLGGIKNFKGVDGLQTELKGVDGLQTELKGVNAPRIETVLPKK